MHRLRFLGVALALTATLLAGHQSLALPLNHPPPSTSTSPPVDMTVRGDSLVVAGDLNCAPADPAGCPADVRAVHDLAVALRPAGVLMAGDLLENCGTVARFLGLFDPVWGEQWGRIAPAIGNHEYCAPPGGVGTSGWASTGGGYFDYFGGNGGRARPTNASYYSFNVLLPQGGHWHVVVLNSACGAYSNPPAWVTPSCGLNGAMVNWLRADLAADTARCELVMFHHPTFATPAPFGGYKPMRTPWWTMELRGVDLAVSAHNHAYERFAAQDHTGRRTATGIRQNIIGTGGGPLISFRGTVAPNSLARDDSRHGLLRLLLRPTGWTQAFRTTDGVSRDAVSGTCRP